MRVLGTTSREIGALHWTVAMLVWVCFGGIVFWAADRGEPGGRYGIDSAL